MNVEFNINDNVLVKLTEAGRAEHKRQHDVLRADWPKLGAHRPKAEDAEGWSTWQMWDLMSTFGAVTSMGCTLPFETTIRLAL